jgi:hypothetical protein
METAENSKPPVAHPSPNRTKDLCSQDNHVDMIWSPRHSVLLM